MSVDVTVHRGAPAPALQDEGDASPASLIQLALEKGVDVALLEKLVDLQERVTERHARAAFVQALAAFRDECPPIMKTAENSQFQVTRNGAKRAAKYAPLEEIDRTARPIAAKHGLVWTWDTRIDGDLMHVSCRVIHAMGHSETTNVSMPYESKAGSSAQQKFGSAQTYGMRYSLIAALGLTTADEDVDGAESARGARRGGGGGADDEVISDRQLADLEALVTEVGADPARFTRWLQVPSLAELPKREYARAVQALEAKRKGGGR